MKRLTFLLCAVLVALTGVSAQNIAKIGETEYETLDAAIQAAPTDGTETTITILRDVENGAGIMLRDTMPKNGSKHYNLIIDFDGHTYDVGTLVGSPKTQTQAVHLEQGQIVHLKNGRLTSSNALMMVQNYCRLTLTNMDIVGNTQCEYVVSNNCGECNILGNTSITATEGNNAFDVCVAANYPTGVVVNVNTTGTITGKIEYGVWGDVNTSYSFLNIEGGNFEECEIVIAKDFTDNVADKIEISGGTFDCIVPAEFIEDNVTLENPSITADPQVLTFEAKSFHRGENIAFLDTLYSDLTISNLTEALVASVKGGSESIFKAELLSNKKVRVSYTTAANPGEHKDTVVISSGETKAEIAVSVNIEEIVPEITVNPTGWDTTVTLQGGAAHAEQALEISVSNQVDEVQMTFKDAFSPFVWEITGSKVVFTADQPGTYEDTIVLTSTGAEPVEVPLKVVVLPEPVANGKWISDPTELAAGDKFYIVNYAKTKAMSTTQNTASNKHFRGVVAFDENDIAENTELVELVASGENYRLKVSAGYLYFGSWGDNNYIGTDTVGTDFAFEMTHDTVLIKEVASGRYLLFNQNNNSPRYALYKRSSSVFTSGAIRLYQKIEPPVATTTLSVSPDTATVFIGSTLTLSVERDGNDEIVWASTEESIATVANGIVTGVAEGSALIIATANNISDTCVVTVTKPVPVISVGTTELAWGQLSVAQATAGISRETTASVTMEATLSVEVSGEQKDNFAAEIKDGKLTVLFSAAEEGSYAAKATLKAEGAADVEVNLSATVAEPADGTFSKVTEEPADWSGKYALVYESEGTGYVFNGKDEVRNYGLGEIENGLLTIEDGAKYVLVIEKAEEGYYIKVGSQYIGGKSGDNTITFSKTPILNTLSMSGDFVDILSNTSHMRANTTNDQVRFRYIKSSSYTGAAMKKVALYKYNEKPRVTTMLDIKPDTISLFIGNDSTLEVERDGNDEIVWSSLDDSIATVADGVVTGVAEGTVMIVATANNISDTCVVIVKEKPIEVVTNKTIAEFIANKGGKCYLTGVVSDIWTNKDGSYNVYGNFNLTDSTGTILVYGLLTPEGESKQFQTMGVDERDTLTILAETYELYNKKHEVKSAIFVSVKKFQADTLDVVFTDLQATYYGETEKGNHIFGLDLYAFENWEEDEEGYEYPVGDGVFASLDLYSSKAHSFAGSYSFDLGEDAAGGIGTEFSYVVITQGRDTVELGIVDGTITITSLGEDNYRVEYSFTDEAGHAYAGVIESTEILAYDEDGDEYPIENGDQAIENTKVEFDWNAPVYNIQGMQVDYNTPGILIQNGRKFIIVQ